MKPDPEASLLGRRKRLVGLAKKNRYTGRKVFRKESQTARAEAYVIDFVLNQGRDLGRPSFRCRGDGRKRLAPMEEKRIGKGEAGVYVDREVEGTHLSSRQGREIGIGRDKIGIPQSGNKLALKGDISQKKNEQVEL